MNWESLPRNYNIFYFIKSRYLKIFFFNLSSVVFTAKKINLSPKVPKKASPHSRGFFSSANCKAPFCFVLSEPGRSRNWFWLPGFPLYCFFCHKFPKISETNNRRWRHIDKCAFSSFLSVISESSVILHFCSKLAGWQQNILKMQIWVL